MTREEAEKIVADPFTELALMSASIGGLWTGVFFFAGRYLAGGIPWLIAILTFIATHLVLATKRATKQRKRYEMAKRRLETSS